jgi:hypothetical protein
VRVKRRGTVRADDAEVLEAIVIRHTVDVVEDQGHRLPAPHLVLAAELASCLLDPLREQPALQMTAMIRRALHEELGERRRRPVERLAPDRVLIEMFSADIPERGVLLDRPVVSARGAEMDLA